MGVTANKNHQVQGKKGGGRTSSTVYLLRSPQGRGIRTKGIFDVKIVIAFSCGKKA